MPVYLMKTPKGEMLVDAPTKNSAINFAARDMIEAAVVTPSQLMAAMNRGVPSFTVVTPDKEKGEDNA